MENCIFCKIAKKEISTEFIHEDEQVMVFRDLHPVKPIHLLIVPKRHIKEFVEIDDMGLMAHIGQVVQNMIRQFELTHKGYRIIINGGGAQEVDHLHIHLMGPMGANVKV